MSQPQERRKLIAFVDGFNLYYGLLKDNPGFKWLDLWKMVAMLHPHYEVVQVKYFTAAVDENDEKRLARQVTYWKALENRGVKIVRGRLEKRAKDCMATQCTFGGLRKYMLPVEKRTDVNLAIHIITDARVMKPDAISIVSADTDMIPAMEMVSANWPCQRFVYLPCHESVLRYRRVDEFEAARWTTKRLNEEIVLDARFPETITPTQAGSGVICCPKLWAKTN